MFRFTIRDVLWLMVVVGIGIAWLESDRRGVAENDQLRYQLHKQENQLLFAEHNILDDIDEIEAKDRLRNWATERRNARREELGHH
jgi:hypothetical protein